MSAYVDRDAPLVMVNIREYVMGAEGVSMVFYRCWHRIKRNDVIGPGARTWERNDGSIEILH